MKIVSNIVPLKYKVWINIIFSLVDTQMFLSKKMENISLKEWKSFPCRYTKVFKQEIELNVWLKVVGF